MTGRQAEGSPISDRSPFPRAIFERSAPELAVALIGAGLWLDGVGGTIVETEAYDGGDPASHSFRGPTVRNGAMFGPVGHAYVYRSYGVHWCFNIVCGQPGSAVLVRALKPEAGLEAMRQRRGDAPIRDLCRGPGRLCQALGIDMRHNGMALGHLSFALTQADVLPEVVTGPRIGITKGVETLWRFGWRGSPFLSRGFPASRAAAD